MMSTSHRFFGESAPDVDDLQRQFERLFGLRSASVAPIRSVARGSFPQVNIGATPEAIEVFAFAPGIDPASLEVTVDKGLLTISGTRTPAQPAGTAAATAATPSSATPTSHTATAAQPMAVYTRERASGSFRRVIALPEDADPSRVDANYRCGVLKVRVEKREASRPRRITVS
jgi:HSP20 family protein